MCSFAGCIPEPDFAFSIVCCFGFLTPGDRSPTLWIKSLGFLPTSSSCNWLAASCLDQPRTSSSEPCPPSVTIEPPPAPQCPTTCAKYPPASVSPACSSVVVLPSWRIIPHPYLFPGSGSSHTITFPETRGQKAAR
ncbi:hypothetical protein CHARACLAT_008373 [Characodon lateralis]|uniref:Uncharacterized protein n=1 Tax=Characodon lateralis TaxID=208331 RepID=A0ABU7E8Q1_9TELE|nr:hypothetical protein [Characodon lateralis]